MPFQKHLFYVRDGRMGQVTTARHKENRLDVGTEVCLVPTCSKKTTAAEIHELTSYELLQCSMQQREIAMQGQLQQVTTAFWH